MLGFFSSSPKLQAFVTLQGFSPSFCNGVFGVLPNYPPCSLLLKVVVVGKSIVFKSQSLLPLLYLCVLQAFTTSQCMFLQWHFFVLHLIYPPCS
jgi:hypothetical protein